MRGAVLHAPGDVRCEHRADPVIIEPTDAIVRTVATCVCGSDLWPYRGIDQVTRASAIGHEYCGIVEQIGDAVALVQPGQFVIGGFLASDNTCPNCPAGVHSSCLQGTGYDGCQSELIRVPLADGTPVPTPELPAKDLVPNLLTLSDVMATGRHAAVSAGVKQGMTVAVVGDGAVGLSGVLATAQLGAERVIAMSHRRLGRRSSRGGTPDARPVLAERRGTRRRGTGAALSAGPAGSRPEPHDRPGKGVRPGAASVTGRRSLPGHGRAPRDQSIAASVST